ncbi:MAG: tetratricopeptide repeat protein [Candidatus Eremiobacterota bacterium]
MRSISLIVLLVCLVLPARGENASSLLAQGNSRMDARDYAGALKFYEQARKLEPDNPAILYNLGLAANFCGRHPAAVDALERYRVLEPGNYLGLTKLIQALEGAGRAREAEARVAELRGWWKSGRTPELSTERSFVREQFPVGKHWVVVFEFFEPDFKAREHTWDFMVYDAPGSSDALAMFYVMYDEAASAAVETKKTDLYFFDVRGPGGGRTLGVAVRKPTYPEARQWMKRAIAGEKIGPVINL